MGSTFYDNLTPIQKDELDRYFQDKYQHNPDFQMCRWLMDQVDTEDMTEYRVEFVFSGRKRSNGKEIGNIRLGKVIKGKSK